MVFFVEEGSNLKAAAAGKFTSFRKSPKLTVESNRNRNRNFCVSAEYRYAILMLIFVMLVSFSRDRDKPPLLHYFYNCLVMGIEEVVVVVVVVVVILLLGFFLVVLSLGRWPTSLPHRYSNLHFSFILKL